MKVVCLDNLGIYGDEELYYKRQGEPMMGLEVGKLYNVRMYDFNNSIGYVIDYKDKSYYYNVSRFKDLRIIREEKLKELGI